MFTAQDVKKLRDLTGAGMLDCKNSLSKSGGDFDKAIIILRKAGQAKAVKKADREANEGLSYAITKGNVGVLIQLQCETDFVAKTDRFQNYLKNLAEQVINRSDKGDLTTIIAAEQKSNLIDIIAIIGENMKIAKVVRWVSNGICATYLHAGGKIGVLVDIEGEYDETITKSIGMHIAAFAPLYLSPEEVSRESIQKERDIASEKTKGKPEEIAIKIIDGIIKKWYTEICLSKQPWLLDDTTNLEKIAPKLIVKQFIRVQIGA